MTDWVELGGETMVEARKRTGLSREALSRKLYVSTKTIERWENRGAVPREHVYRFAGEVGLEVEELPRQIVQVATGPLPLEDRLEALEKLVVRVLGAVNEVALNQQELREQLSDEPGDARSADG